MPMLFSPTPHVLWRLNSFGSFATFAAIRRAALWVNNLARDRRPKDLSTVPNPGGRF
jgi:hypothetical protein